jgi:murein L,D-transpeptidase YcbB/YkuD
MLQSLVESCSVKPLMDDCMPHHPVYARMRSVLARYRDIAASGGWAPVAPGPTLEKQTRDPRVIALRRRLAATGDLRAEATDSDAFDEELEGAVIRFQSRHRLQPDGRVGKNTLQALNVPVSQRIDTIRVALERLRWVIRGVPKTYVLADIAHFEASYYVDNRLVWKSRTQVGRPYRETPVFRSDITYLVFNPTWTIPPGILAKDILPAVQKDPDYLKERNIRALDKDGNPIETDSIEWAAYTGGRFPYQLRQDPGPANALGRVKFMFPNPHHVYMHDTPSKALFERENRAFSSGCIRIEKPLDLAALLLNAPDEWRREKIEETIESGETRTVRLKKPVPVLLLYSTAWVDDDGTVYFTRDIYGRDAAVLRGLDSAFRIENGSDSRPAI